MMGRLARVGEIPAEVIASLEGSPAVGLAEQAFPLLTTDPDGQPRAMLVSRAETATAAHGSGLHIVLRPSTSRCNIERSHLATLLVTSGEVLHSLRLRRAHHVEDGHLQAIAFTVTGTKADTVGIPLTALGFTPTDELLAAEHWQASANLLHRLASATL